MRRLRGKRALVTGACSGIGRKIAERLAAAGVDLVLLSDREAGLREVIQAVQPFGVDCRMIVCDLSQESQIDEAVRRLHTDLGPIDLLINNAGMLAYGRTHFMVPEWTERSERVLQVNLLAPMRLTTRLLPQLLTRPEPHIVNVSSMCGFAVLPRLAVYQASKFGLLGFSESLRVEYGRQGVGVTTVCPGFVRTPLFERAVLPPRERPPQLPAWMLATPDRVAAKVVSGLRRNRRLVVVTPVAHALYWTRRLAPWLLDWLAHWDRVRATRRRLASLQAGEAELAGSGFAAYLGQAPGHDPATVGQERPAGPAAMVPHGRPTSRQAS